MMRGQGHYIVESWDPDLPNRGSEEFDDVEEANAFARSAWGSSDGPGRVAVLPEFGEVDCDPSMFDSSAASIPEGIMKPFAVLTVVQGLSVMEALSYCLCRIEGMDPSGAAALCTRLTGRRIGGRAVSNYVQRARWKLVRSGVLLMDS